MTFNEQTQHFMNHIETRRKNPAKASTLATYRSLLSAWVTPALGARNMTEVQNPQVKGLVDTMFKAGKSASTITTAVFLVKQVMASAKHETTRTPLYPVVWDDEYLEVPAVLAAKQDAVAATPQGIEKALQSAPEGQQRALYALLPGTGIRIGEARALRVGVDDGINSFWAPERALLVIRTTISRGRLQDSTKTLAGTREVDLAPELNQFMKTNLSLTPGFLFQNSRGGFLDEGTLYRRLVKAGIEDGYHSFRRFRVTYLENSSVPLGIIKFWVGHSGSTDITSRYVKVKEEIAARKNWCEKAGLGFQLEAQ